LPNRCLEGQRSPPRRTTDLLPLGCEACRLREVLDLTQEELADRAGLHPNYIGRIERGESNVGVKALFKLARGLGVEPAALFER
jgi:transcriptional regulator with XRE-family HTH domain